MAFGTRRRADDFPGESENNPKELCRGVLAFCGENLRSGRRESDSETERRRRYIFEILFVIFQRGRNFNGGVSDRLRAAKPRQARYVQGGCEIRSGWVGGKETGKFFRKRA